LSLTNWRRVHVSKIKRLREFYTRSLRDYRAEFLLVVAASLVWGLICSAVAVSLWPLVLVAASLPVIPVIWGGLDLVIGRKR
jgi:hypothetical protein